MHLAVCAAVADTLCPGYRLQHRVGPVPTTFSGGFPVTFNAQRRMQLQIYWFLALQLTLDSFNNF